MLASWFMHQWDVRQAAMGRTESAVEVRDNAVILELRPFEIATLMLEL